MAEFSFKIARGWDVDDATNIEDIITDAPTVLYDQLVPLTGNVRKQALDSTIHRSGKRNVIWTWDHITQADKIILLHYIFPSNENSAHVTVWTINEDGEYEGYNATAERPRPQEHYQIYVGGAVDNFPIPLWDLNTLPFSFDDSFIFASFG